MVTDCAISPVPTAVTSRTVEVPSPGSLTTFCTPDLAGVVSVAVVGGGQERLSSYTLWLSVLVKSESRTF